MSSYDVKALFTLVPVDSTLNIIHNKLLHDTTLPSRTPLSIPNIKSLLRFCLKSTFFTFQTKYYKQIKGAAMGSCVSQSLHGRLQNQSFKFTAQPTKDLAQVVNDAFVMCKAEHTQQFLTHLNSLDSNIQFITESQDQQGSSLLGHLNITRNRWHPYHFSQQ